MPIHASSRGNTIRIAGFSNLTFKVVAVVFNFLLECVLEKEIEKIRCSNYAKENIEELSRDRDDKIDVKGTKFKFVTTEISTHTKATLKTGISKMFT